MNLSLREIEYVLTVAAEENITRAAEKLYIAQPSLSQAIKKIEDEVGYPLFTRIKNKMKLTEEGKLFIEAGVQINKTIRDLQNRLHEHEQLDFGHLAIGMPYHLGGFIVPPVLATFRKRYPNVKIDLYENHSSDLENMLIAGTIDLAILPMPLNNTSLSYKPLVTSRMILIIGKENPLNLLSYDKGLGEKHRYFDLRKAADEPFILGTPGQRIRSVTELIFKYAGISPRIALYSRNIETIKHIAATGMGLALIPEQYLRNEDNTLSANLYYLDGEQDYTWKVVAVYLSSSYISPAAKQFIALMNAYYSS